MNALNAPGSAMLPPADALRETAHNEIHTRPSARIRLPALVLFIAVSNTGIEREQECAHLNRLPGQGALQPADLQHNFLSLRMPQSILRWERHGEFTRYMLVQDLPSLTLEEGASAAIDTMLTIPPSWLAGIPGKTLVAIQLVLATTDVEDPQAALDQGQAWFGARTVVASLMGNGHSLALTDFRLQHDGYERILVLARPDTTPARAGRIAQRLLDMETYRLMALRGLPVAKDLGPMLMQAEAALADVTASLEHRSASEADLLDSLIHLAARVERATAEHAYRFSATQAYERLVRQRITEMREKPVQGTQTIGEFLLRRLSPAIATVAATENRLNSLSQRIERTSGLLRTRVDIATETQNQQLLAKLTRGQELQLRLQATVEGLSIAAISYYVVSLLLYAGKSVKAMGAPLNPEMAAGALIPLVLFGVWRATRRIHARLH